MYVCMDISINVSACVCARVRVCEDAPRQISLSTVIRIVCLVVHDQSVVDEIEAV